jgi:hypothetical protein
VTVLVVELVKICGCYCVFSMGCFQSQPEENPSSSVAANQSNQEPDASWLVTSWNVILCGQTALAEQLFQKLKGYSCPDMENTKNIMVGNNLSLFIHLVVENGYFPLPEQVRGIVFIVDAANKENLVNAKHRLEEICRFYSEYFNDLMLLVLAQGTEEPGAVDFRQVKHLLNLRWLPVDGHYIQSCSVETGEGVEQGFTSLIKGIIEVQRQLEQDERMQSMLAFSMFMNPMPLLLI